MATAGPDIDVTPSVRRMSNLSVAIATELKDGTADAIGYFVATEGHVPREIGVDRATLTACGFDGTLASAWWCQVVSRSRSPWGTAHPTRSQRPDCATRQPVSRAQFRVEQG
jgi:hypothetical protein